MSGSPLHSVGEEIAKVAEFLALLQREQVSLTQGDTETLQEIGGLKNQFIIDLSVYSSARESSLRSLGFPAGREGINAWLERSASAVERKQWATLLERAAQVRAMNETNGKLIQLHLQHNQQAFNTLMAAASRTMTYGPDGQQHNGLGGRILGKA